MMELAGAKTTARTGWQRIGIKTPESLADHSALSGQIAYVLALMEGANADRAAALSLFHDQAELRIGDANWVARTYIDHESMKVAAIGDQINGLPIAAGLSSLQDELKAGQSKEAVIAYDADWIDMAIQSKYYADAGNKKALLWLESIQDNIRTESGKEILAAIKNTGIEDWWMEMDSIKKKFEELRKNS